MFIGQLHANLCRSLINTCTNHLHIVLNFLNFDLSIFGSLSIIGTRSSPGTLLYKSN